MLISGLTGGWGGKGTAAQGGTEMKTSDPAPSQTAPAAQGEVAPSQQVAPIEESQAAAPPPPDRPASETQPALAPGAPVLQAADPQGPGQSGLGVQGDAEPAAVDPDRMAKAVARAEREAAPASVSVSTGVARPQPSADAPDEEAAARSLAESRLRLERLSDLAVRNYAAIHDLFRSENARMADRAALPDAGRVPAPGPILKAV